MLGRSVGTLRFVESSERGRVGQRGRIESAQQARRGPALIGPPGALDDARERLVGSVPRTAKPLVGFEIDRDGLGRHVACICMAACMSKTSLRDRRRGCYAIGLSSSSSLARGPARPQTAPGDAGSRRARPARLPEEALEVAQVSLARDRRHALNFERSALSIQATRGECRPGLAGRRSHAAVAARRPGAGRRPPSRWGLDPAGSVTRCRTGVPDRAPYSCSGHLTLLGSC